MAAFGIQLLEKGLALCGKNFKGFVDAWNHVVNRSANIRGDGDTDPANGLITVDNTDADHPVIRLDRSRLGKSESGESGGGEITLVGTDNESVVCSGGKITFESAEDSNVVVKVSADDAGNAIVTIGVYYK